MQIDPWVGEEDTSINATNTELLIVIKRKCAYSEHQICTFDYPKSSFGSCYPGKADRDAKRNRPLPGPTVILFLCAKILGWRRTFSTHFIKFILSNAPIPFTMW